MLWRIQMKAGQHGEGMEWGVGREGGPLTLTHKEGEELRNANPEHSEEFLSPNLGR